MVVLRSHSSSRPAHLYCDLTEYQTQNHSISLLSMLRLILVRKSRTTSSAWTCGLSVGAGVLAGDSGMAARLATCDAGDGGGGISMRLWREREGLRETVERLLLYYDPLLQSIGL